MTMLGTLVGTKSVMSVMGGSEAGDVSWATGKHVCFEGRERRFTARIGVIRLIS